MSATSPTPPRRRAPVVAAAGLAAVAVVAAAVVVGRLADGPDKADASGTPGTTAAYFLGPSPTGLRLYAEPHTVPAGGSARVLAALRLLATGPTDPDYRTAWPAGSFRSARVLSDRIVVGLSDAAARRPADLSPAAAVLGLQQAVYTADAAAGTALPLEVSIAGGQRPSALGISGRRIVRDTSFGVTAPVDIGDLADGATATHTLTAGGSAGPDVTTVRWRLTSAGAGGATVRSGRATPTAPGTTGPMGTSHWTTGPIDLSGLAAGGYVLIARVTATGQTSASPGNFSDSRRVTIP